jgi:RNA polymerase-binding protein DksA
MMAALSKTQIAELSAQLKKARDTLLEEIRSELENAGGSHRIDLLNSEPGDYGDEALADALADFSAVRIDRQVRELRDIDQAFRRIADGTYGICVDCGQEIGYPRLKAYPTAKRCIVCQEKHEKLFAGESHPRI